MSTETTINEVRTRTEIADEIGLRPHQVRYMIGKLKIRPVRKAGSADLYSAEDADRIKQEFESRRRAG